MKTVLLVGPTASGKSDLALDLAEHFGGAILNADSVQVYQRLLIGSAAPSAADRQRVPHFLFQEYAPPKRITAGEYARRALEHLLDLQDRYPVVFIVGGTGFYLMALEKGMLPIEASDPETQARLQNEISQPGGAERLHRELAEADPVVADRISVADHYRLTRAIEVLRGTGRRLSEIEREHRESPSRFPYPLLKLGVQVDREVLRERVRERTRRLLRGGLIDEVQGLIRDGFRDWEPLQSVGYKETLEFLGGTPDLPDLAALQDRIVQNTMRLAKKQQTWFKRDAQIQWAPANRPELFREQVQAFLRAVPR